MPPPEKSSYEDLAEKLAQTSALAGCDVRAHAKNLVRNTTKPRVVLIPLDGDYAAPSDSEKQIALKKARIDAHIYGDSQGLAEDLEARLFQALDAQAIGDPTDLNDDEEGGFYDRIGFRYPTAADSSVSGAALIVTFTVEISLLKPAQGVGLVSAIRLTEGDD